MKKSIITSVLSYVFLIVAIVLLFTSGAGTVLESRVINVESGLTLAGYNLWFNLMSLFSGGLMQTNPNIAIVCYIVLALFAIAVIVLMIKKRYSDSLWRLTYFQITITLIVTISVLLAGRYISFKNYSDLVTSPSLFIVAIVFFVLYGLAQVVNYVMVAFFTKKEAEESTTSIVEEVNDVEKAHDEPVEEDKSAEEETKPEEPSTEKEVEAEEQPKDDEPVAVYGQTDEKPEEEADKIVEETPVVEEANKLEESTAPVEENQEEESEPEEDEGEDEEEENSVDAVPSFAKEKFKRITFEERLNKADPALIEKYKEIRDEIMSYGVKSRVSSTGDTFRLHTVKYMKIVVAGKKLKLYMKLSPRAYDSTPIPHGDASTKSLYTEIPFVFKVGSDLSVKRAKGLIKDMMDANNIQKKKTRRKAEETKEDSEAK